MALRLPIELWHSIFDHLELADLFSCTQVSKAVYFAVTEYRIRELAFTGRVYTWFHFTPDNYRHRADFTNASILKRSSFNFEFLKRLKIGRYSPIDLNAINKLTRLEELDIDLNYEQSGTLSLANLKVLYVYRPNQAPLLVLHTPRLNELRTFSLANLEFAHPESLRCLHTFHHNGMLSAFLNLEYLTFTNRYNLLDFRVLDLTKPFDEFNLTSLNKLKELEFFYYHVGYEERNLSKFREIAEKILQQKRADLKRADLKVFWKHVQITNSNLLTEYEQTMYTKFGNLAVFHLQHYEKLRERADFFWHLGFNETMSCLTSAGFDPKNEEFVAKFLAKYSFAKITVDKWVKEPQFLMQLIGSSPMLSSLQFSNSNLDQRFFDEMAETIRLKSIPLKYLYLQKPSKVELNYEFVCKLLDLWLLQIDQPLPGELVLKLLRINSLARIQCFSRFELPSIIERLSANRFDLNGKLLNLQELLERFNVKSF